MDITERLHVIHVQVPGSYNNKIARAARTVNIRLNTSEWGGQFLYH